MMTIFVLLIRLILVKKIVWKINYGEEGKQILKTLFVSQKTIVVLKRRR